MFASEIYRLTGSYGTRGAGAVDADGIPIELHPRFAENERRVSVAPCTA